MLVVAMCFAVVSCGGDSTPENTVITNDFGAKLEGGGFDAGAVLNTEPFAADSAERANAIEKIVEYGVPLEQKAVAVYDIDATGIALDLLGRNIVNTIILGYFAKKPQAVSIDSLIEVIKETFPGKVGELNVEATKKAYDMG